MENQNQSNCVLGFAPSRKAVGIALTDGVSLHYYKLKPLKRYNNDTDKLTAIHQLIISFLNTFRPKAIIAMQLIPQNSTDFNVGQISFLKELAQSRMLSFHSLAIKQVKALLSKESPIKNQRQLAKVLSDAFPELSPYLSRESSGVVKDREKYYRPIFSAIGLGLSYFKLIENEKTDKSNP